MPTLPWLYFLSCTFVMWGKGNKMCAMASFLGFFQSEGIPLYRAETGPHAWRDSSLKHSPPSVWAHTCGVLIQSPPRSLLMKSLWPQILPVPFWAEHKYRLQTGLVPPWNWANSFSKQIHLELRMLKHCFCTFLISRVSGTSDAPRNKLGILSSLLTHWLEEVGRGKGGQNGSSLTTKSVSSDLLSEDESWVGWFFYRCH